MQRYCLFFTFASTYTFFTEFGVISLPNLAEFCYRIWQNQVSHFSRLSQLQIKQINLRIVCYYAISVICELQITEIRNHLKIFTIRKFTAHNGKFWASKVHILENFRP